MKKNTDLLRKVLNENFYQESSSVDLIEEGIYQELDALIYEEVRNTLRNTILESSLPADEKVEKISKLEKAAITKEHAQQFLYENVYPILEVSGINSFQGDNPVFVDGPVLEAAIILDFAKRGKFRTLKNLLEDHEEIFNDYSGKNPRNKEDILESSFQNIFKHWGITSTKEKKKIISEANKHLRESGIDNLLWNPNEVAVLLNEEGYSEADARKRFEEEQKKADENWQPETDMEYSARRQAEAEANESIKLQNINKLKDKLAELRSRLRHADANGIDSSEKQAIRNEIEKVAAQIPGDSSQWTHDMTGKLKEGEKTGILRNIWSTLTRWTGSAVNAASELKKLKDAATSKTGAIVIGTTLLGLIAAYIWKRRNDKCRGLSGEQYKKCQRAAADAAIAGVRAQLRNCPKSANPSKCQEDVKRVLASWQSRKAAIV
jgi:hypothetical protein